jgi:hypothetical protein
MRKEIDLHPYLIAPSEHRSFNENKSQSWLRYLIGSVVSPSVFSLIVLFILLFIPITVLVVGINYRDPHHCPIEPRISVFLIVNGSVSLAWIILIIITTILTTTTTNHCPLISLTLVIVFSITIIIGTIFSIIWTIIGSVWTFNVYYWVTYYYDTQTNFYPYNYCQPELYRFTFVYLILSYVFTFLQCGYHCINNKFTSTKQ